MLSEIPLSQIDTNPLAAFRIFRIENPADRELLDSMAINGLLQPITLAPVGSERYLVLDGERRLRAAQCLSWDSLEAIVRPVDGAEADLLRLAEQAFRRDVAPYVLALAVEQMFSARQQAAKRDGRAYTVASFAKETGLHPTRARRLRGMVGKISQAAHTLIQSTPELRDRMTVRDLGDLTRLSSTEDQVAHLQGIARSLPGRLDGDALYNAEADAAAKPGAGRREPLLSLDLHTDTNKTGQRYASLRLTNRPPTPRSPHATIDVRVCGRMNDPQDARERVRTLGELERAVANVLQEARRSLIGTDCDAEAISMAPTDGDAGEAIAREEASTAALERRNAAGSTPLSVDDREAEPAHRVSAVQVANRESWTPLDLDADVA